MKLVPNHQRGDLRSTAHTEDNFKPKAAKDFVAQWGDFILATWKWVKFAWGIFHSSAKIPITRIPIGMTGFLMQNFNSKCYCTLIQFDAE